MKKIAIPTAEGKLWPHFGKAPQVTFFTVDDNNNIVDTCVMTAPEHAHGAMPRFLQEQGATETVCGGLGAGAVEMLRQLGIAVHAGAPVEPVEDVEKAYLNGAIVYGDGSCHHDNCEGHHQE